MLNQVRENHSIFVVGHLPISGIAKRRNRFGEVLANSERFLDLFDKYQVAAYISGHQHAYYPSKIASTFLINSGGFPARQYVGSEQTPVEIVSVLSVNKTNSDFYVTSYEANSLKLIKKNALPNEIKGYPITLRKFDIRSK